MSAAIDRCISVQRQNVIGFCVLITFLCFYLFYRSFAIDLRYRETRKDLQESQKHTEKLLIGIILL